MSSIKKKSIEADERRGQISKEIVVLRRCGGEGEGEREGVVLHDSFFYQLIKKFYQLWEHSNVKHRNYKRILRG